MATYTSNYAWTKPSGGDPVDIEVLNDNLDNQDSIVHQAFLDLAPVFSTANTYAVKDVVLYDNKVWICHTAVTTAGAWTGSTNWTQTTVGETGGVATYADLPDKPSINGNELSGNKTGAQLGLQNALTFDNVPTANSTNPVKSGGVYSADEAIRKWTTAEAKNVSGDPITLTDGSARNAEGLAVTLEPKQSGSGTPSPTNVRPITGYTECVVDRDSKNLVDVSSILDGKALSTDDGSIQIGSEVSYVTDYIPVSKNQTIYIPATGTTRRWFYDANKTAKVYLNNSGAQAYTPTEDGFIRVTANKTTVSINALQIEYGTTATPYVPYSHDTATIAFGQTVYGGSVDFKTGKVTVTHGIIDGGDLTYNYNAEKAVYGTNTIADMASPVAGKIQVKCSILNGLTPKTLNEMAEASDNSIAFNNVSDYKFFRIKCTAYTSGTDMNTAMTGQKICYELATPIELTLTPAELELLKGYNYITTNGTTIALNYLPDSLLAEAENYVDAKIPPAPTTNGTYVLTCTVTDGTPAYSWESAT